MGELRHPWLIRGVSATCLVTIGASCAVQNKYKYSDSALSALDLAVGHEVCPRGVLNSEDQFQYLNLSGGFLRYVWLINFARGKVTNI